MAPLTTSTVPEQRSWLPTFFHVDTSLDPQPRYSLTTLWVRSPSVNLIDSNHNGKGRPRARSNRHHEIGVSNA